MIEDEEGKNVCESGPGVGLCKGENKSNIEQKIAKAIREGLQEYDDSDAEPDMDAILAEVQEKLGIDEEAIEWYINVRNISVYE